jgi:hypothetical protein
MNTTTTRRSDGAATIWSLPGWLGILVASTAIIATLDVVFLVLVGEVIPPLAIGAVLTLVGVLVVRRAPTAGAVVLSLTTIVMLIGGAPFAIEHLAYPESGVDWIHAVVGMGGRLLALGAAVALWRSVSAASARVVAVTGVAALGLVVATGLIATAVTSGDDRQPGDVLLEISATEFPDRIEIASGEVLFIDNRHMFRHTFTVEGTDIDVPLPALQGVRVPIELPPGTYEVHCAVPGHESMTGHLIVH